MPPVYQPEVAAEGIFFAAGNKRREVWVGATTVAPIVGNKIAPALLDRYLGRTGFASQQTDQPVRADRPANLWGTGRRRPRAHGIFDGEAHRRSAQLWATRHRRPFLAAAAVVATTTAAAALGRGRS